MREVDQAGRAGAVQAQVARQLSHRHGAVLHNPEQAQLGQGQVIDHQSGRRQVSGVAIPLLAVLTLQATPLELDLVTASSTLAFALVGLPAGVWLDPLRRRPVLVASDLVRALLWPPFRWPQSSVF